MPNIQLVKSVVSSGVLCVSESWAVKKQTKTKANWTTLKCGYGAVYSESNATMAKINVSFC